MSTQGRPAGAAYWKATKHAGNGWRSHPVPYDNPRYPWRVPPMACASCGTRRIAAYRTLRTEQGQVLVLHSVCANVLNQRLNTQDTAASVAGKEMT